MLDVDLVKLLPVLHHKLQQKFKLPGILPGGSHCMMNAVSILGIRTSLVIPGNIDTHVFAVYRFSFTDIERSMRKEGLSWAQICISPHQHRSHTSIKMVT